MSTRKTTLFYATLISVASMAIGMVITSRLGLAPPSMAQSRLAPPMNSAPISGPIDANTFRDIAEAQTPMVVNIRTESRRRTQELTDFFGGDELFRRFFGQPEPPGPQPRTPPTLSAGTGFVIDATGFILTNHHVVEGATKIEVGFFGEERELYEARLVGQDQLTDSALIELIEKPDRVLPEAVFGDSDEMKPGDWVMADRQPVQSESHGHRWGHQRDRAAVSGGSTTLAECAPDRRRDQPWQLGRTAPQPARGSRGDQYRHRE